MADLFDVIDELRDQDQHTRSDVERLRQLTEVHSDCAELWDVLGDIMQICVDHDYSIDESLECYRRSLACDSDYAPAHVSLAYAYDTYRDDFCRALDHFRLALANGAGDTARIGIARVLAQLGQTDNAIAELDACSNPDHAGVLELRRETKAGMWFDPPHDEA